VSIYASRPWAHLYGSESTGDIITEFPSALAIFRQAVARAGDLPAIKYFDASITYAELDQLTDALACALLEHGVQRNDRVALYLQNVPQFVIGLVAAWKVGAIGASMNPMNREREMSLLIGDCRPKVILCHELAYRDVLKSVLATHSVPTVLTTSELEFQSRKDPRLFAQSKPLRCEGTIDLMELIARYEGCRPPSVELASTDPAALVYTSGTTGVPKGAVNTHGNIAFASQLMRDWFRLRPHASVLGVAPLFHITGLIGHITGAQIIAGPLVLAYRFDAGVVLDAIHEHRPEFTVCAITALIALMNQPHAHADSFRSFTYIASGGAPIAPAVVDQFEQKFGTRIKSTYGMTESTAGAILEPIGQRSPVDPQFGALALGVPAFNTDIKLVDEQGEEVAFNVAGELLARGPQIVPEYWNRPDDESLCDGWVKTGDIMVMNEQGWLFLVDRKKDMINASGYKVWPREVEDVLYTHPAVREAAVVPAMDQYRGETVKAVLSLKPGANVSAAEITEFCKARMAAYKYPRIVEILPELPKTVTGKILRRELRAPQK
jgi:long-chain acyl-CoA synthetase